MFKRPSFVLMILVGLCIAVTPAMAQDMDTPEAMEETPPAAGMEEEAAEEAVEEAAEETEEAIDRVPTYEEAVEEPEPVETPQAAFLRLAEDYIFRSEIGTRHVGNIPVWPRGAFKAGPVNIFPYIEGRVAWTDNSYQDDSEKSSLFFTEGGGFTAELPFLNGQGVLSGGGDYKHFDYVQEDLSYSEWVGGIGVTYNFPQGLWVASGMKWERLVDPVRLDRTGLQRRDHWYPYFDLGLKNAFGNKIDITLGVDYENTNYKDDDDRDETSEREEWTGYIQVSYPFIRDTTRVFVRYQYTTTDAESERINDLDDGHEVLVGIDGDIPVTRSGKLVGTLGFGYRRNAYDDSRTYRDGNDEIETDDDQDKGSVTVRAALRYMASEKTSAELRFLRDLDYSPYGNYQTVNRFDLVVTHTLLRRMVTRAGIYLEYDDPSADEQDSVTEFGVGCGARYLLDDNVDIDLAVDWFDRNSDNEQFDYNRFLASLGVTLYFR